MIIPKHLFADYIGGKSREAPTNLKPVGTGPYMFKDFKPGDIVSGVINPNYHQAEPALFRQHRDEGRRRRRVGGARGAADRRIRLRLEHAGRGRDPAAPGEGRQGQGRRLAGRQHRAYPGQQHRSVDRGRRRARRASRPSIRPSVDPAVRQALALLVDKASIEKFIYGRTGQATANFVNNPRTLRARRPPSTSSTSTRPTRCSTRPAGRRARDGIRAKDGKKLKFVFQTSINQPRQKTQAIVKQACQKAGIDIEVKAVTASVFFSSDVANPDTYPHFYTDLQMYTVTMTQPDPEVFMRQFLLGGGGDQGEQVAGPQHHALAEQGIRRDPQGAADRARPGQARRAAHQVQRHGGEQPGRDPGRRPPRRRRHEQQARGRHQRLGQQYLGPAATGSRRPEAQGGGACPRQYLLRRLLIAIPSLLGISVVLFTVLALAPGRSVRRARDQSRRAARGAHGVLRAKFGLDDPIWTALRALAAAPCCTATGASPSSAASMSTR